MTTLSRRVFLKVASGAGLGTATLVLSPQGASAGADDHTLVLVTLRGGLDGLSAVVPTSGHYRDNRSRTAVPEEAVHRLDDRFGLHPALGPLLPYFEVGELAPVVAVGSPLPSRSHFDQQAVIDLGIAGDGTSRAGWLGRLFAGAESTSQLRGMSVGHRISPVLRGAPNSAAIGAVEDFEVVTAGDEDPDLLAAAFVQAAGTGAFGEAAHDAVDMIQRLRSGRIDPGAGSASYPDGRSGRQFRDVARVIRAGIGLEAAAIDLGGWDTHAAQGGAQGRLADRLRELGGGLAAFLEDLSDLRDRITVVVVSEFGRRVRENGARGTDHGRGGVALVAGGGIRGGQVHGDWPGIAPDDLDDGDVRVTTDVRDVLAEVVHRRLGYDDLGAVFPGHTDRPLGLA